MPLSAVTGISLFATAQNASGPAVTGQVIDRSGAAIVGARVQAISSQGFVRVSVIADGEGRFTLPSLPAGIYELVVTQPGFRELRQQVSVQAASTTALQLTLPVSSVAASVNVTAQASLISDEPTAQTEASVSRGDYRDTPATTLADVLELIPGVTVTGGNGPRDSSISVRGSNDRQSYGIRNVQVLEDGFPVTQPDGTARADLADPHAYSGIDVVEGPSSALYGNYATGGALNFHTRSGAAIQGLEIGADFGSFRYFNDFAALGVSGAKYQVSIFLSNVRSDQATSNSQFNTITANILSTIAPTPHDRFTFKFVNNDLDTNLSIRLSLAQYRLNPYQQGCQVAAGAIAGCATINSFVNGFNGTTVALSAAQAGLGRHDRRTIAGARWEHDLTPDTTSRTQFVFDDRDIDQPTGNTSYRGPYPSFNFISDVTRRAPLRGRQSTSFGGGFFNYENINSFVYNVAPGGAATLGGQVQTTFGRHLNAGFRGREELALAERWTLVAGAGGEYTALDATETNYSYPVDAPPTFTQILANRTFFNIAPEAAVQYRPTDTVRLHARFGTGYGTPQVTQLFVTPAGVFGNNTQLKTQRNYGFDLGGDVQLRTNLQASLTGFDEFFRNEMVTQSAGVNLQSYTFNAPASRHRGMEVGLDWHPFETALPGARVRVSYLHDNQIYTNYTEQLTSGAISTAFNRNGNFIPGVQSNFLNGRLEYDQPTRALRGFGAYLEANWRDNYHLDNANFLTAPGYTLLNLSTHYDPPRGHGALSRLRFYFDLQNLTNRTYVNTASNITDSLNASTGMENGASVLVSTGTGSVYAGTPRASYGGVRVSF